MADPREPMSENRGVVWINLLFSQLRVWRLDDNSVFLMYDKMLFIILRSALLAWSLSKIQRTRRFGLNYFLAGLGEIVVWLVLLSRLGTRKTQIWSPGMEHSVRFQRVRPTHQCEAVAGTCCYIPVKLGHPNDEVGVPLQMYYINW